MGERYMLPIIARQTAASASGSTVWAMRLPAVATMRVKVKRLQISSNFDGTAAASQGRYDLARFNTATPTGGTALTIAKKRSSAPASAVTDARRLDTGLTVTSVVFEAEMLSLGVCRQRGAQFMDLETDERPESTNNEIELLPGEGLCVRLGATAVIGDELSGYIEWEEVPN